MFFDYKDKKEFLFFLLPEINLHFHDLKDDAIDGLLDSMDSLNESFAEKVGDDLAANFNFHLDVK